MSWDATRGLTPAGAQHGRGRFIRPKRASSANMIRKRRPRGAAIRLALLTASEKPFVKVNLRLDIRVRMNRARHQLASVVAVQKIIDRAVAGRVPDGLFIRRFEIVDVYHLSGAGGFGK